MAKFKDQPQKVQEALIRLFKDLDKLEGINTTNYSKEDVENAVRSALEEMDMHIPTNNGEIVFDYDTIKDAISYWVYLGKDGIYSAKDARNKIFNDIKLNNPKDYSELTSRILNKYGVKGVSYNGRWDGECAVIFDNKAINIIDKFKREEGKWVGTGNSNWKNVRYQKAERKQENINKKGFNYVGGYDGVYGATVHSERFMKMSKAQQNKIKKEAFENDEIARQYTDVFQVTFTEDSLKYEVNKEKAKYFEDNEQLWDKKEVGNEIVYERVDPMEYQTRIIRHKGANETKSEQRDFKQASWYKWFQDTYNKYKVKVFEDAFDDTYYAQHILFGLDQGEAYKKFSIEKNKGWQGEWYLKHGIDFDGRHIRGINEVISEIPMTKQRTVVDYFVAKHLVDLYNENPDLVQTFTKKESEDIIKEVEERDDFEQIEGWRQEVIDFQKALFHETLVKSEIVTEKEFEELFSKRPNYMPLNKIIKDDVDYGDKSYNRVRGMVNLKQPIKKLGNSKREIINPFESIQNHAMEWAVLGAKNRAAKMLIDTISNSEVVDTEGNVTSNGFGIFRKVKVNEKTNKIITSPDNNMKVVYIWRNGQKEFYQVADPQMFYLVKTLNEDQAKSYGDLLDALLKASQAHTAILRTFSTSTPDFAANNITRDT